MSNLIRFVPVVGVALLTFFLLSLFSIKPAAQEQEITKKISQPKPIVLKATITASDKPTPPTPVVTKPIVKPIQVPRHLTPQAIKALGACESGNNPTTNTGNGFYGAFQFTYSTWLSLGMGYARADLAPYSVQVEAVQKLLSVSNIYNQFPACAIQLRNNGLI